jgi:hypothetical protein
MVDQKQQKNVEYFNHFASIITADARFTRKLDPELSWQKQHSTRKRLLKQKIVIKFKGKASKVLHLEHSFACC